MLNFRLLFNIILIGFLVFIQVFLFDRISFNQIATPYVYILFILLYPTNRNPYIFLILSFLLGWGVDFFEDTGGIHAFACISIAMLKNKLVRLLSGTKYFEIEEFSFGEFSAAQWALYALILVLTHHFILFFIESLSFSNFKDILFRTIYCSAFTLIFVYSYLILFSKKAER